MSEETATQRVDRITASTDPRSALGMQLADLAKAKRNRESMDPAARAALTERDRQLALAAVKKFVELDAWKAADKPAAP